MLLSIAVGVMSVNIIAWWDATDNFYWPFSGNALGVSAVTLITTIMMLLSGCCCPGSCGSYNISKIIWLWILWIAWIGNGAWATLQDSELISTTPEERNCVFSYLDDNYDRDVWFCHEIKAIAIISFIVGGLLGTYTFMLTVLNCCTTRGRRMDDGHA